MKSKFFSEFTSKLFVGIKLLLAGSLFIGIFLLLLHQQSSESEQANSFAPETDISYEVGEMEITFPSEETDDEEISVREIPEDFSDGPIDDKYLSAPAGEEFTLDANKGEIHRSETKIVADFNAREVQSSTEKETQPQAQFSESKSAQEITYQPQDVISDQKQNKISSGVSKPIELPVVREKTEPDTEEEDYSHYEEAGAVEVIEHETLKLELHKNLTQTKNMPTATVKKIWSKHPVVAVVIDDMGDNVRRTRDISSLHAPLTASFLTYPQQLDKQVSRSVKSGQEIMVHVPMQPKSNINMSPDILTVEMSPSQINKNFRQMLHKFHHIKGINNHMGSRLTEDSSRMSEIMKVLKEKNLFFLDSKTTPHSVGKVVAQKYHVRYASRHVFLDNKNELNYILHQLAQTEKIARKNGYAIAIGHPKTQTFEALKKWLPTLKHKNIQLVHLSKIIDALNENR